MKTRILRSNFVEMVADAIPYSSINDLPMIRQYCNDLADSFRKEGCTVPDWDQGPLVRTVRRIIHRKACQL